MHNTDCNTTTMQHIKSSFKTILLLSLILTAFQTNAIAFEHSLGISQDSLVLKKIGSRKEAVIQQGQLIKVILYNSHPEKGEFKSLNHDTLILLENGVDKMILVKNIRKIKVFSKPLGRAIGGAFILAGVGAMFLGGISLIAGVAALLADNIGAIILVAVPFLGGAGLGSYKIGMALDGKKYNLKAKWHIVVN